MEESKTCDNCVHDDKTPMEWPCINCINNARDYFQKYSSINEETK